MSLFWTHEEHKLLVEMWNADATLDEIMAAIPRHAGVVGIQKACTRLRKMGFYLQNRQMIPDAERKRRAGVKTGRPQGISMQRPVTETVDPFAGVVFEDDPRAYLDGGVVKVVPQVSDWVSLTGSSASLAVRQ